MPKKILQINSHSNLSGAELREEFKGAATPISEVAGLVWKIFAVDEERAEAAGLYLFEDEASLEAYIAGPIVAAMKSKPAFSDIEMKVFDVAEEASRVTRAPF